MTHDFMEGLIAIAKPRFTIYQCPKCNKRPETTIMVSGNIDTSIKNRFLKLKGLNNTLISFCECGFEYRRPLYDLYEQRMKERQIHE